MLMLCLTLILTLILTIILTIILTFILTKILGWVGWAVTKCGWRLFASHGRFRLGCAVTIKLKYWVGWALTNYRLRFGWAVTIKPKYWVRVGWAVTKYWWRFPRQGQVRFGCNNLIMAGLRKKRENANLVSGLRGQFSTKITIFNIYTNPTPF